MNDIIYLLQYFKVPGMAVPCLHIDVVVFPIDHTETRVTYPPLSPSASLHDRTAKDLT